MAKRNHSFVLEVAGRVIESVPKACLRWRSKSLAAAGAVTFEASLGGAEFDLPAGHMS